MRTNLSKTIRIVGASSAIAQDFLRVANGAASGHIFHLYSREFGFLDELKLNNLQVATHTFDDFMIADQCDAILNFVGLGSPSRVARESSRLEDLDLTVDLACIRLLELNPDATYLYMSSGASYGSDFSFPATDENELPEKSKFELPRDIYGWVKRSTEARHRALPHYKIINLRIFGYASRNMDLDAGFLLSDLAKSLLTGQPVRVSTEVANRDFINPEFFHEIINFCIEKNIPNTSIDLTSSAPLGKGDLVDSLVGLFGLKVLWEDFCSPSGSTSKRNYFSLSKRLRDFGFTNSSSAMGMVLEEFEAINNTNPG